MSQSCPSEWKKIPSTVICQSCRRGVYRGSSILIAADSTIVYESSRLLFVECLNCQSRWIFRFVDGKPFQHGIADLDALVRWEADERRQRLAPQAGICQEDTAPLEVASDLGGEV